MSIKLAKDVITPWHVKFLCEQHWQRRGVANALVPTTWFVEFIQGFGFRLSPEPPWREPVEVDDDEELDDDCDATVYHDA